MVTASIWSSHNPNHKPAVPLAQITPPPPVQQLVLAPPPNMSSGQSAGFNPLADLTSARYAGYLNMPSADMFGPDGGALNNDSNNQDELLRMMENPIFQSQMNEMLSNPQMLDFMIQSNPQFAGHGSTSQANATKSHV
ncbi:CGH_1_HP_G0099450.mRNA.1.CDS.1 [Saccharomyces cerevisiae]|nr:CGH_1_HP_G0099450.mRNA.1.CDS.1 [Saccharomyces cerevisiae]CAI6946244.1 CGH_1_HP_G0099450.mRNA.1.CDS.1 [Saccharomyces cerevisiae]